MLTRLLATKLNNQLTESIYIQLGVYNIIFENNERSPLKPVSTKTGVLLIKTFAVLLQRCN